METTSQYTMYVIGHFSQQCASLFPIGSLSIPQWEEM